MRESLALVLSAIAVAGFGVVYVRLGDLEERMNRTRSETRAPPVVEHKIERARPPLVEAEAPREEVRPEESAKLSQMEERLEQLESRVSKGRR